MQFIFTADIHLDSKFQNENTALRNGELISYFEEIVNYGKKTGVNVIVLGGDIFDTPYPSEELKTAFKNIIMSNPDMLFLAICGNHDPLNITAFYSSVPENFYVFPDKITPYQLEDITIYGISEKMAENIVDPWKNFKAEGRFITLSHGDLNAATLANTGASLCLLGHIHKTNVTVLTNGAIAIHCGTPAGRGFDECGQKGFYVIDTEDFNYKFIKTSAKIYKEYEIDISELESSSQILDLLQSTEVGSNEIARAILTGKLRTPFTIDCEKLHGLVPKFLEIKDKSDVDIDVMENINENTLEGEFVRLLTEQLEKASPDDRQKILDSMKEGILALRRK